MVMLRHENGKAKRSPLKPVNRERTMLRLSGPILRARETANYEMLQRLLSVMRFVDETGAYWPDVEFSNFMVWAADDVKTENDQTVCPMCRADGNQIDDDLMVFECSQCGTMWYSDLSEIYYSSIGFERLLLAEKVQNLHSAIYDKMNPTLAKTLQIITRIMAFFGIK